VAITGWLAPDHQAPAHIWIVSPDGLTRSDVAFQVLSPPDATGACTLSLVLPLTTSPGNDFLIAGSANYYERSDTVVVQNPALATTATTPAPGPTPAPTPSATQAAVVASSVLPKSDNVTLLLGIGAGVMLLLVLGGIVLMIARRRP
jgi:hypothetical protein